jgi:hypothetical protein
MKISEKSVLPVTILLRKVARCILGTRNWVLTLLRRQRKKNLLDQLWEAGLFVKSECRIPTFKVLLTWGVSIRYHAKKEAKKNFPSFFEILKIRN